MVQLPYQVSDGEKERRSKICRMRKLQLLQATQRRKMLCKTRRSNSVITVCRSLSLFLIHLAAFASRDQISRLVTIVDESEPVDETMSGNQFRCKNK